MMQQKLSASTYLLEVRGPDHTLNSFMAGDPLFFYGERRDAFPVRRFSDATKEFSVKASTACLLPEFSDGGNYQSSYLFEDLLQLVAASPGNGSSFLHASGSGRSRDE